MRAPKGARRGLVRLLDVALSEGPESFRCWLRDNSTENPDTGCRIWNHGRKNDYGYICDPRKPIKRESAPRIMVSRLVCEVLYGEEADLFALHSCDNPPCINPDHLSWGTKARNLAEARERGLHVPNFGESNGRAKVPVETVIQIRSLGPLIGDHLKSLSRELGVHKRTIQRIANRQSWGHL